MSYCPKCGSELKPDSRFCPACGAPVNETAAPRAAQTAQDDQPDCNKWFGVLAYLGPVLFVPMFVKKDSKFAQFHVRQGFNLLLFYIASIILRYTLGIIPYVGTYFFRYVIAVAQIGIGVFAIIGIVNALRGKMNPLPLFGDKLDLLKMIFKV